MRQPVDTLHHALTSRKFDICYDDANKPSTMVALGIKPSASGLVTHERMTAYIASKGVNELYADSLEALLRAEPANPAEFLADHFASMTDTVETYADTYVSGATVPYVQAARTGLFRRRRAACPGGSTYGVRRTVALAVRMQYQGTSSSPQWSPPHDTVDLRHFRTSSLLHLRTPPPPPPPPPPLLGALPRGDHFEAYALTLPLSRWRR